MQALKTGEQITIGSKGYTIGTTITDIAVPGTVGDKVTINGTVYEVVDPADEDAANNKYTQQHIEDMISDGDTVIIGTRTHVAMIDTAGAADGVGDNDASIISAKKAYELIAEELELASSVGVDPGSEATVTYNNGTYAIAAGTTQVSFSIQEGSVATTQGLQFTLHVGADADESNKIALTIDAMDTTSLGVANINVVDNTGAKATYAIDSIADAIAKVSAQRSALGAVQNRLEHTIANLDNVVENTTAAESEIRDTDMAEQMVDYSKNNILMQAGQSMLTQANQATQGVLSLLG